jgi:hypothetical protein
VYQENEKNQFSVAFTLFYSSQIASLKKAARKSSLWLFWDVAFSLSGAGAAHAAGARLRVHGDELCARRRRVAQRSIAVSWR